MPGLPIYKTSAEKKQQEIRNGAIQFLAVLYHIGEWKAGESKLTPALLLELQRLAINQIYTCAGTFRDGPVRLEGAVYQPPTFGEVPALVDGMCDYVNNNWDKTAVHLSAYLMWRLNWIHPFFGGNGRTARAIAYLILCARLGFQLPGEKTIPDLIVETRNPYYDALVAADTAWAKNILDISQMESLMSSLLADQLYAVHRMATGALEPPPK